MSSILKNYSLSLALFLLFALSWAGQGFAQWEEFKEEQITHKEEPTLATFMPEFTASTLENWQSEFLQLFTFVVLATYLVHKNSPQSRDGDDRRDAQLNRIEKMLKASGRKT